MLQVLEILIDKKKITDPDRTDPPAAHQTAADTTRERGRQREELSALPV